MYHWTDIRGLPHFGATLRQAIAKALAANSTY